MTIKDGMSYEEALYCYVIEALKKQIPKKPKAVSEVSHYEYPTGDCPNCQNIIGSNHRYCEWCGQALDWGKENEV